MATSSSFSQASALAGTESTGRHSANSIIMASSFFIGPSLFGFLSEPMSYKTVL